MINLKESNPAAHIGGLLWLQGNIKGYSSAAICGLMKISMFELGINSEGQPSANNTTYKQDNNAFGMMLPKVRPTKAKGERKLSNGDSSAVFSSVWDSVADVFLWLEYNKIPDSVRKTENCDSVIDFCQSKNWMPDMTNYKKVSTTRAESFIKEGRNAFFVRFAIYTSITIIVLGFFLKKNRTKFRAYYNKLGVIGKTLLPKPTAIRRRAKKVVSRTKARVRMYRRSRAKK